MKIIQVSTSDRAGGAEKVAVDLHVAYKYLGHDAELYVGRKRGDIPHVFELPNDGLRNPVARSVSSVHSLLQNHGSNRVARIAGWAGRIAEPLRTIALSRGLEDCCFPATSQLVQRASNSDVVHLHNLHGDYFDLGVLPVLSETAPTFLTLHDEWTFTGHCAYTFDCDRWQHSCGKCPSLGTYPAIRRDASAQNLQRKRDIFTRSRLYVASPSQWLLDRAKASALGAAIREARLIPYGIDTSVFKPMSRGGARQALQFEQERPIAVFVGNRARSSKFKDLGTILDSLRHLQHLPSTRNLLVICLGDDGPDERIGEVEVRYAGYVADPQRVALYLQSADIFLHAAHVDNFPCAILEAMACECCVIATAVGGISEQIEDQVSGILVPAEDPASLAKAFCSLLEDDSTRRRIAKKAADIALRCFGMNRHTDSYLEWYGEIVSEASASHSEACVRDSRV